MTQQGPREQSRRERVVALLARTHGAPFFAGEVCSAIPLRDCVSSASEPVSDASRKQRSRFALHRSEWAAQRGAGPRGKPKGACAHQ